MAERHADGAEEIVGTDAVGIPLGDVPFGYTERVFLTIGELEGHRVDFDLELTFRMDTIDGLIVDHTAIVGEEGTVLTGDIDQRGGETVRARTVVAAILETGPVSRFRTTSITVTGSTGIASIDRTETTTMTVLVRCLHIVIQAVTSIES